MAAFFEAFGSTMEVQEFNPFAFTTNDTEVHTVVHWPRLALPARASTTPCTTSSGSRTGRSPLLGHRGHLPDRGRADVTTTRNGLWHERAVCRHWTGLGRSPLFCRTRRWLDEVEPRPAETPISLDCEVAR